MHSLHSRPFTLELCTLNLYSRTVLSSCTLLSPLDSVPLHSLYSRLCTLATVLSHCTDTLCTHNLCTLDFGFSQSLHSRLCTLRLHSRLCILALSVPSTLHSRVLHSNTLFILALSVLSSLHSASALSNCALIVHCAPSRLCALALSALSTLHSRLCTLDFVLSSALSTLYSRVCTLTLYLALCSHRALCSLLSNLCPRTLCILDSELSHSLHSLHSQSLHSRLYEIGVIIVYMSDCHSVRASKTILLLVFAHVLVKTRP